MPDVSSTKPQKTSGHVEESRTPEGSLSPIIGEKQKQIFDTEEGAISTLDIKLEADFKDKNYFHGPRNRFPLFNPEAEKEEKYYKNKTWLKIQYDMKWKRKLIEIVKDLQPLILGKFCIESTASDKMDKWDLQSIRTKPCDHQKERFV